MPILYVHGFFQADTVAGLFTPYIQDDEISLRVTGLRDMDGQNPVERPERVEALLEVAQKFAGSDFSLGCFMFFQISS